MNNQKLDISDEVFAHILDSTADPINATNACFGAPKKERKKISIHKCQINSQNRASITVIKLHKSFILPIT